MTNRTIDFYIIEDCSGEYSREDEYFDNFDDAYSHINDLKENGRFKYTGWWTDNQECNIIHKQITPTMKVIREVERWEYKCGKLFSYNSHIIK